MPWQFHGAQMRLELCTECAARKFPAEHQTVRGRESIDKGTAAAVHEGPGMDGLFHGNGRHPHNVQFLFFQFVFLALLRFAALSWRRRAFSSATTRTAGIRRWTAASCASSASSTPAFASTIRHNGLRNRSVRSIDAFYDALFERNFSILQKIPTFQDANSEQLQMFRTSTIVLAIVLAVVLLLLLLTCIFFWLYVGGEGRRWNGCGRKWAKAENATSWLIYEWKEH